MGLCVVKVGFNFNFQLTTNPVFQFNQGHPNCHVNGLTLSITFARIEHVSKFVPNLLSFK